MPYAIPMVIERRGNVERSCDIYSRLLKDRIILLGTEIDDAVAEIVCAELLFLEGQDPARPISLYINSPGGSVTAGLAIYDTMRFVAAPVSTLCYGMAASMAAFLLAAGSKGMRYALPHSTVMIHQPLGGCAGQASDVEIHAREMLRVKQMMNGILAESTGQSLDAVKEATDRDTFLTPEAALEFGMIDRVLASRAEVGGVPAPADQDGAAKIVPQEEGLAQ